MRHLYALLTTVASLIVTFAVYALMCWILDHEPTQADFTFVLVVNLMFQFYCEALKRIDKEK